MRHIFSFAVALPLVIIGGGRGSAAAPDPRPPRLEWEETATTDRWVLVRPEAANTQASRFAVPDGASFLDLPKALAGTAMVCFGGRQSATLCHRAVLSAGTTLRLAGPVEGVRVEGAVLVGSDPAADVEIGVAPHPLTFRQAFVIPLEKNGSGELSLQKSKAGGRFAIPLLAPGTYILDLHFPGGRREQSSPFTVPEPRRLLRERVAAGATTTGPPVFDLGEISISQGARLEVQVVDGEGKPVPGAGVGARQALPAGGFALFEAYADSQGIARLTGLDPTRPSFLTCLAPGFLRREDSLAFAPPAWRCELQKFSALAGEVVDPDDQPVPGAEVTLRGPGRSSRTDREGRFRFGELAAGAYELVVAASGFEAVEANASLGAEERSRMEPIRLTKAVPWTGRVVDRETAEPVAQAVVTITDPAGAGSATSDEEGSFTLSRARSTLTVSVSAAHYPTAYFEALPKPEEDPLVLQLSAGGRIRVSVWDEKADAPCVGCSVVFHVPGESRFRSLITDTDGEALSPLLPPGRHDLTLERVESTGSLVQVSGGDNVRNATVRAHEITHVSFGERRLSVEVALTPPPPPGSILEVRSPAGLEACEISAAGTCRIRKPAGEAVTLVLRSPARASLVRLAVLAADFAEPSLDLPLGGGEVTLRLTQDDRPLSFQRVEIVGAQAGNALAWGETDTAGSFSAMHLSPGLYQVRVDNRLVHTFLLKPRVTEDLGELPVPAGSSR